MIVTLDIVSQYKKALSEAEYGKTTLEYQKILTMCLKTNKLNIVQVK